MTAKSALLFLEHLRSARLDHEVNDLAAVVEAVRVAGFDFTVEELRVAYKQIWGLRWLKWRSEFDKAK